MTFYIRSFFILTILYFSIFGYGQLCTSDKRFSDVAVFTNDQINVQRDVPFANVVDWKGQNETLKLDVYYPSLTIDTMAKRPFIMMIHGGGLVSGEKINFTKVCIEFAKRGFVAATIDYRLGFNCNLDIQSKEKAAYRAQQDANAALRFAVQNAKLLRIDTSWMFVGGGSAGSVTALGIVYISQKEWNSILPGIETTLGKLNANGNNLTHKYSLKGIFNNWGAMLTQFIQDEELLPMVSFHGDNDTTVGIDSSLGGGCLEVTPSYGSRQLHYLLTSKGVCSDLSVRPGGGHGVYEDSLGVELRVGRAACFFKSIACQSCTNFYQIDSTFATCSKTNVVDEIYKNELVTIQPNPFYDHFSVTTPHAKVFFTLRNINGSVVYKGKNIEEEDFSHLPRGLYLLYVQDGSKHPIKLIKI